MLQANTLWSLSLHMQHEVPILSQVIVSKVWGQERRQPPFGAKIRMLKQAHCIFLLAATS